VIGAAGTLAPRKSLGQHFLHDPSILSRIVQVARIEPGMHVVEVGPGPGGLTRALLQSEAASVTAVEIDRRALDVLGPLREAHPQRLRLIQADATRIDCAALVPAPRTVVANLPYNVATPLLIGWLRAAAPWQRLTLMFQQEVADRIVAEPGSAAYGRLSVLAQFRCEVCALMRLPPGAFLPPPKVWSAVVGLVPRTADPEAELVRGLERVTAAAFGQRRKMLRGSLRGLGGEALLARAGIDAARRAETLKVAEFVRLAELVRDRGAPDGC
jgi:16S rRNA (adenine1518-N6/adenine1519-N6)-dimethyltransferase